jgi:hypothetical protein
MYNLLNSPKPILYVPSFRMQRDGYLLRTIRNMDEMEDVYRLTYRCYVQKGYCNKNDSGMLIHYPHLDDLSETRVFVAEDDVGKLIGTISNTIDSQYGLNIDEDFLGEINQIRKENRVLASTWRFATDEAHRSQARVARLLLDGMVAYMHATNIETCLTTVHPHHEAFHSRYLNCRTVAKSEGLKDVNSEALLMRWDSHRCPLKKRLAVHINDNANNLGGYNV